MRIAAQVLRVAAAVLAAVDLWGWWKVGFRPMFAFDLVWSATMFGWAWGVDRLGSRR